MKTRHSLKRGIARIALFGLIATVLAGTLAPGIRTARASEPGYAYKDETTKLRLSPAENVSYGSIHTGSGYIVWQANVKYVPQIYAMDLAAGKSVQITDGSGYKGYPSAASTTEGILALWMERVEGGVEVRSYNLATGETKVRGKLPEGAKLTKPAADDRYMAWGSEDGLEVLDLASGEKETVPLKDGLGALAVSDGKVIYQDGLYDVMIHDPKTKQTAEQTHISQPEDLAAGGKYVLVRKRPSSGKADYVVFDAANPQEPFKAVAELLPTRLTKLAAGDTYAAWIERGDGETAVVHGVDLLYKTAFELPVQADYERVFGFNGDKLVYMNEDGFIVLRSITPPERYKERQADPIYVVMDGEPVSSRVPPISLQGSTYVEFRSLFERMGYSIKWDNATRSITAEREGTTIRLTIGKKEIAVNGKVVPTKQAPIEKGGYTYVPLRLVSEVSGRLVSWNDAKRTVYIRPKNTADTLYYEDGTMQYHGGLANGVKHGHGTQYRDDGTLEYVGQWKDGKKHGQGQLYYAFVEDVFFEGTYVNDRMTEGTEYYPGGMLRYEGTYTDKQMHWEGIDYVMTGSNELLVVEVREGKKRGKAILYRRDMSVKIEGTYEDGRFIDGILYDEEGNELYRGEFDKSDNPVTE